jgi:hypothetical protein
MCRLFSEASDSGVLIEKRGRNAKSECGALRLLAAKIERL